MEKKLTNPDVKVESRHLEGVKNKGQAKKAARAALLEQGGSPRLPYPKREDFHSKAAFENAKKVWQSNAEKPVFLQRSFSNRRQRRAAQSHYRSAGQKKFRQQLAFQESQQMVREANAPECSPIVSGDAKKLPGT